ncbi:MAG: AAA family ATPase [Planctomycetota bacterium]
MSCPAPGHARSRSPVFRVEADRLLPFAPQDFQALLDAYFGRFPELKSQRCHLFRDEVQRIEGWESFVRRALDTEQMDVYVTGSSAKLL